MTTFRFYSSDHSDFIEVEGYISVEYDRHYVHLDCMNKHVGWVQKMGGKWYGYLTRSEDAMAINTNSAMARNVAWEYKTRKAVIEEILYEASKGYGEFREALLART